jgi:hypothetical protein
MYVHPVQSILHVKFNSTDATQKIISLFNACRTTGDGKTNHWKYDVDRSSATCQQYLFYQD